MTARTQPQETTEQRLTRLPGPGIRSIARSIRLCSAPRADLCRGCRHEPSAASHPQGRPSRCRRLAGARQGQGREARGWWQADETSVDAPDQGTSKYRDCALKAT
jgi:hypothetical protein